MRIHTDTLSASDFYSAAIIARVSMDLTEHGSRSRNRAFNVLLTGESRRRTNPGHAWGEERGFAATWDQWGVFLAVLFAADDERAFEASRTEQGARRMVTPYYATAEAFAAATGDRSGAPEVKVDLGYYSTFTSYGWPEDAHGDHSWMRPGRPGVRLCRDCSAEERWGSTQAQYLG